MSDTLDRLKALGSKLDVKLSEKKKKTSRPKQPSLIEEEVQSDVAAEPAQKPARKPVKLKQPAGETPPAKKEETASSLSGESSEESRRLGQILLHHLGIDSGAEPVRAQNLQRLAELFLHLEISKKVENIEDLFIYKAMNISGIGLKEEDFGEIREGKYVQVIAITYEPDKNGKKKAKNISLGYFGKAESLDPTRKNQVIEFVLRWRYEKAFQNLEHYRLLLEKVRPKESLF
ncbi:MAG TPA: hypothetical protein ENJ74_03130 [Nitratifractor salsuginis]|uniref:Uncharacterized protein n=1 Tax=Nitratifractor salsuginis TaxID=269261 RepID=A0A7V2SIW8_9BACT|nr:hypothetical protein [Nitratifractor salsuginis]